MTPFSLLIKPVSADCNLSCDYCFYLPTAKHYPKETTHRMADAVLEQVIKTYMETSQSVYTICWQGGEPTLAGLDFFEKAVAFQKKYGRPGARVSNAIQTNATRISDDMAKFFRAYRFLVGCSLDGPAHIHDRYRRTCGGKKTYKKVIKGIDTLRRHHVDVNILTLVSQANKTCAGEIYTFLKKKGFHYQQYIPCVEYDTIKERPAPYAISGKEWGIFLSDLFDAWYPGDTTTVSIRNFETVLSKKVDGTDSVCITGSNCQRYFVVEHNGDIYPCDFFVTPEFKLGNIMDEGWKTLQESQAFRDFGCQKSDLNTNCRSCDHLPLCGGDCLKNRMYLNNPASNLSHLCPGIRNFFDHTGNGFDRLEQQIRQRRGQ
ncbi:MAG TPA: anaerobic sulfatase maturase [Desulfobacteraceae bacterium]|nr:anaerobic sulfatase maturase [Desulfobacteraceae bacterium]